MIYLSMIEGVVLMCDQVLKLCVITWVNGEQKGFFWQISMILRTPLTTYAVEMSLFGYYMDFL